MTPKSEAELAQIVAAANAPVTLKGGGTRGLGRDAAVLDVSGLAGIQLYEPGALTLVAQAGTPVADIEAALAAENQQLAFEPMDHRTLLGTTGTPTIGGVVAGNISGSRRIQVGACRDHLLGVRYVDGRGQVIKNGGRVMKNVTGYDLVKLMAGSWGTLGVLSEVSLKVLPRAETQATICFGVDDVAQAVAVLSSALGSPFEVSGAAYDPGAGHALIRVEGFAESVRYRCAQLEARLLPLATGATLQEAQASAEAWADIRDVRGLAGQSGDIWRISVKPSDAPEIASRLRAEASLFDWGGGLIWARVPEGSDLRARLGAFDGHATLVRATAPNRARLGTFHPMPAAVETLSEALRDKFDPRGLFNPGLMTSPVEA